MRNFFIVVFTIVSFMLLAHAADAKPLRTKGGATLYCQEIALQAVTIIDSLGWGAVGTKDIIAMPVPEPQGNIETHIFRSAASRLTYRVQITYQKVDNACRISSITT